jgi:hypothetical protein
MARKMINPREQGFDVFSWIKKLAAKQKVRSEFEKGSVLLTVKAGSERDAISNAVDDKASCNNACALLSRLVFIRFFSGLIFSFNHWNLLWFHMVEVVLLNFFVGTFFLGRCSFEHFVHHQHQNKTRADADTNIKLNKI